MNDSFVYKWTNTINGRWYIGSHKGTTDDGYRHSSEIMKLAEAKHGVENFTREILFEGNHEKDKIKSKEAEYLNKYDAANNPMSYNRTNITGPNCFSKETREKQSIAQTGRITSKETKAKQSQKKKGKSWEEIFGVKGANERRKAHNEFHHTDETKQKMSEAHKLAYKEGRRVSATKGRPSWNKGKTWEEMYGIEKATKMKDARKKQNTDPVANAKRSKAMKGKPWSVARRAAQEKRREECQIHLS